MSQMKKTVAMNTPAKRRLRGRFSDIAPTDAGAADAPGVEPHPETSKKPTATRTKTTAKKTKGTRQKKPKAAEPETEPLPETTPAAPQNPTGDDEMEVDPTPATETPAPPVKKRAPPPATQGTRASARLRGQTNTKATKPVQPKAQQTRRRKPTVDEVEDEDATAEPPNEQAEQPEEGADAPENPEATTADAGLPNLAPRTDDGYIRRFYIRRDAQGNPMGICLGLFTPEQFRQATEAGIL